MSFQHMKIYLIGFMGCGKSTIAKVLSQKLSIKFVDLDHLIEIREGKSIGGLFESLGEEEFRRIEAKTLNQTLQISSLLISTGGGTPCFEGNIDTIVNSGKSIYLQLTPEKLAERLYSEKNHRPIIKSCENKEDLLDLIANKLKEREKFYKRANYIVDADKTVAEVVNEIIDLLTS